MGNIDESHPGAILKAEPSIVPFKGEKYEIVHYFWYDPLTKKAFDTTETADATLNQIYNAYRTNRNILFPDQLIKIRKSLGLTPAKMSALLGLDEKKYRFYENGAIPMDEVCETQLKVLNSKDAVKEQLEKAREVLSEEEYSQVLQWCEAADEVRIYTHLLQKRDKNNGYAPLNDNRLKNAILHFLSWHGATDPMYLNRILFYTDFVAFRTRGMAITGLSYRDTTQGPAPTNWNYIAAVDDVLAMETEEGIKYHTKAKVDYNCFSKAEVKILNNVFRAFANTSTKEISKLSRLEDAWVESDRSGEEPISFDYAFTLKAI